MASLPDSTCNLCGSNFTTRLGHTCPTPTTTRTTTTQSRTQQDSESTLHHLHHRLSRPTDHEVEIELVNGVPVSRKTSNKQSISSESYSSYSQNPHTFLPSTGTLPQHTPHTSQPTHSRVPAANTLLISEPSDHRSIRSSGDDDDDETRLWIRGGGGNDGGSSLSGSVSARKGKDLYLTWNKGKDRRKQ